MIHLNNDDLYQMNHEELLDELFSRADGVSPDKLNEFCQLMLRRGGKFALLARAMMGEDISQDKMNKFQK